GGALSPGRKAGAVVDLVRRAEAKAAAGTVVEVGGDLVAVSLGEMSERDAFRQILADESVGVLVDATLPGVVRSGKVDGGAELTLDVLVAVEFDPVVGSNGADLVRLVAEQLDHASVGVFDGGAGQWPDPD